MAPQEFCLHCRDHCHMHADPNIEFLC